MTTQQHTTKPIAASQPVPVTAAATAPSDPFKDKTVLGFWIYLMTDCVLFATLFATYGVLHNNVSGGETAKELFSMPFVLVETVLLLTSSYTAGLAMLAAHKSNLVAARGHVIFWFGVTFLLGLAFLGMELHEFSNLVHEGNSWRESGFLSAFFTLVGTHGLHIASGLIWMAVLLTELARTSMTPRLLKRFTLLSLFWHLLDIVWIFIFTIVYLLGAV